MITRSAYVKSPGYFEVRDTPVTAPEAGHLLIQIAACGVCGTDLHIADRGASDWQPFGHEISGIVRVVGSGVTRFAAGDRVALDSSAPCGQCDVCLPRPYGRARPDLCTRPLSFWGKGAMGFSQMMLTPQECAVHLPASVPLDVACLVEPVGVSIDLTQTAQVGIGDHVLILGPGPLGLAAITAAARAGAEKIFVAGRSSSLARMAAAKALGADVLIETDKTPLSSYDFGERRPDKVLVTSPPSTLPEAIGVPSYGGVVAYIGIAMGPDAAIQLDVDHFHFRKLSLRASHASPATHALESLRLLETVPEFGRELISHRFGLEDIASAMETAKSDRKTVKKMVMVNPEIADS